MRKARTAKKKEQKCFTTEDGEGRREEKPTEKQLSPRRPEEAKNTKKRNRNHGLRG